MDPLSTSASVLALLQATNVALSLCFKIRTAMRKVPLPLIRLIEEMCELRSIVEAILPLIKEESDNAAHEPSIASSDATLVEPERRDFANTIREPVLSCTAELAALEALIQPMMSDDLLASKRHALVHAMKWQRKEDEIKESLARLERCKGSLGLAINSHNAATLVTIDKRTELLAIDVAISQTLLQDVAGTIRQAEQVAADQDIADWVSKLSPATAHATSTKLHQQGTGQWLLDSTDFTEWLAGDKKLLWITGPPGAGKSVLFSHVTNTLLQTCAAGVADSQPLVAYTYCDFRNPPSLRNCRSLLGSLLNQLCRRVGSLPSILRTAYQKSKSGGLDDDVPIAVLTNCMLEISKECSAFLLIDAVDESAEPEELYEPLTHLLQATSNIHVFLTSRNTALQTDLCQLLEAPHSLHVKLEDRATELAVDINTYVTGRLAKDGKLRKLSSEMKTRITTTLNKKDDGLFLLAQCQLDELSRVRRSGDIDKALEGLPRGLEQTYGRILLSVPAEDAPILRRILTWLAFFVFPLTAEELWEAIAIEAGARQISDKSRLLSPSEIQDIGNSLVSISSNGYLRLAHLSIRDYLLSDEVRGDSHLSAFAMDPEAAHTELALDCLTYLRFSQLSAGPAAEQSDYLGRLERLPLLQDASRAWSYHYRAASPSAQLRNMATSLFTSAELRPNFMSWVQIINADHDFKWNIFPRRATPLYYAASFGVADIVRSILSDPVARKQQINAPGSRFGGTPIHAATIRRHTDVMLMLLEAGADPGQGDFNSVTPLHSAAGKGFQTECQILIAHGAPLDAVDNILNRTPLQWAQASAQQPWKQLLRAYDVQNAAHDASHEEGTTLRPSASDPGSDAFIKYAPSVWRRKLSDYALDVPNEDPNSHAQSADGATRTSASGASFRHPPLLDASYEIVDASYAAAIGIVPRQLEKVPHLTKRRR